MPYDFAGEPANIENNLPTVKSVSSTTNATPIVITTSTAHGLRPGDYFTITGATDPNANGTFRAGLTASTTQVQLLNRTTGASIAGTLAGGAAGSLQAEGFGTAYQIPVDLTDLRTAASIAIGLEALGDRTAYLFYRIRAAAVDLIASLALKANIAGPTFTGTVTIPTLSVTGNATVAGIQGVALNGTQPAKNADPGANNLAFGANQSKAWGKVTTTNTATSTLDDGINTASVTNTLSTIGIVTFARPMANANYSITMQSHHNDAYAVPVDGSETTNGFHFNLWKTSDFVSLWALDATGHRFSFHVDARQ